LDPSIDQANGRTGKWAEDEDGGENWALIAALVPGRTKRQCASRWNDVLDPSIDRANGRTGKWSESEVIKLEYAVNTLGDKDWVAIAAWVPGRTTRQCWDRLKEMKATRGPLS
jgi:hypothetical protein